MDIGKAFGFVYQDERWVTKVLIGGVIFLIPIVGQLVVIGYMLKVAQNVAQGSPNPLPEWNEFGDHLVRGLYGFVIQIVYFIPYIAVAIIFGCLTGALAGAAANNGDGGNAAAALLSLLLVPIYLIVAFVCLVLAYAGLARYVATNSLGEALKFGDVFATVRSRPGPWLMLLLVSILAGLFGALGLIACGIGVLFTAFISYCILGHALGQTVVQEGMLSGYSQASSPYTPPEYGPPPTYQ